MDIPIITRQAAYELGRTKFFTGIPCKRGHKSQRYVSTGNCIACMQNFSKRYNVERPKTSGGFWYPLAPKHHAKILAMCQALDMEDGRVPYVPQEQPPAAVEPVESAAPVDEAEMRKRISALHDNLGAKMQREFKPREQDL